MAQAIEENRLGGFTRRKFLGMFSLGLATAAGAGLLFRNYLPGGKGDRNSSREFPGEDSIFHPRRDPREDALERGKNT